jgi:peptidyl-prolyl cis-trans isomerase B (cyclophilin B)
MATKHKAAHEFTIASVTEKTALHRWVERYWIRAVIVALLIALAILLRTHFRNKGRLAADESWDRLRAEVDLGTGLFSTPSLPEPAVLAGLADELHDEHAGPWAKALEASRCIQDEDYAGAERALAELRQEWPAHPLATEKFSWAPGAPPTLLADHLTARLAGLQSWEKEHPSVLEEEKNAPLPEGSPRVRFKTDVGDIVLGLYTDLAPRHSENFVKLAKEGFFDGTRFHRVIQGFMIQGGDPNTKGESDPSTWGQGDLDYKLDSEPSALRHLPFVLAAAKKPGDAQSSACQFYITTADARHLDGVHTIFGALVEGEDVVKRIETAPVEGDRPLEPVHILSTEVF